MIETPEQPTTTPGSGLAAVLTMSWPASLTMLNATVVKFIDGLMVSWIGPVPVTAQFYGGMVSFAPESLMLGLLSVVSSYVSQNLGGGRTQRCAQYAWAGLALAMGYSVLIAPLALASDWGFALLDYEEAPLAAMYFRYMILAAALTLSARVLEQFFYGIHRPRVVLVASVIANLFNVAANYGLIFGRWGLPELGLEGAAIGSVLAWGVQLAILLGVFLCPRLHAAFGTRQLGMRWRQIADILRTGWPAGVQLCNDIFSWGMAIMLLSGIFGLADRVATTIMMRYIGLSFMPAIGVGIATTSLVGRAIGEGRPDLAVHRTRTALGVTAVYMGLCGLGFYLFRYPLMDLFITKAAVLDRSPEELEAIRRQILDVGGRIMICAALFQLADAVGIVYIGALRGAGDTRWPMVATIVASWMVVVGGGVAMVTVAPQLGATGPWIAATGYVFVLGALMAWRFERGAWRSIDLLGRDTDRPGSPPAEQSS
ncbi:MAG: MATE family efflux transporter [Phycisphaerae bacterium]